jgi:hypothetical protein
MDDAPEERGDEGDEPFDPDKRELCPDGMCIGVIGPDGRCKVCGKPGSGRPRAEGPRAREGVSEPPAEWRPKAPPRDEDEAPAGDGPDPGRERVPCPDGMCTGIIGRNGRCGTCGKPRDWKEPD